MGKGLELIGAAQKYVGKKAWLGDKNEKCQKIKKMWIGDATGKARTFFSSGVEAGEVVFTASQEWIVPDGVKSVDIFCVGGGGGAGGGKEVYDMNNYPSDCHIGSSGAGGYTSTLFNCAVTPGESLIVSVGSKGIAGNSYIYLPNQGFDNRTNPTNGAKGGTSSVMRGADVLLKADGGNGGISNASSAYTNGVNGGSGGGCGGSGQECRLNTTTYNVIWINKTPYWPGAGGCDGGDGHKSLQFNLETGVETGSKGGTPGKGQGRTTRYFEESGGTLYSTANAKLSSPNTGDGGYSGDVYGLWGNNGYSGIVIIRWKAQEN